MARRIVEGIEVETGSGNVFANLNLPDADKLKIKSGRRMGIPQPKVSALLRGDFANLSERKLINYLNRLGYDIEITVKPAAKPIGHLTLAVAKRP